MKKVAWLIIGLLVVAVIYLAVSHGIFAFREGAIVDTVEFPPIEPSPIAELAPFRSPWDSEASPNWRVAAVLGKMSELSYESPIDAEAGFKELGFTETHTLNDGSMVGYVASADDVSVVVFRGTNPSEISDWIVNLNNFSFDTPNGSIHNGFRSAYLRLKPQLIKVIEDHEPEHIWVTGHSLGGALSLACVHDLIENEGLEIDGIVTFGQPMVARGRLADYLDTLLLGKYARFVNGADTVPRIPITFSPCGRLVWFTDGGLKRSRPKRRVFGDSAAVGDSGDYAEITPLTEEEFADLQSDLRNANEVRIGPDGRPLVQGNSPLFIDHDMATYARKVRQLLGGD